MHQALLSSVVPHQEVTSNPNLSEVLFAWSAASERPNCFWIAGEEPVDVLIGTYSVTMNDDDASAGERQMGFGTKPGTALFIRARAMDSARNHCDAFESLLVYNMVALVRLILFGRFFILCYFYFDKVLSGICRKACSLANRTTT